MRKVSAVKLRGFNPRHFPYAHKLQKHKHNKHSIFTLTHTYLTLLTYVEQFNPLPTYTIFAGLAEPYGLWIFSTQEGLKLNRE